MDTALLILNAGSSSLKFAVYRADTVPTQEAVYRGSIEAIGQRGRFRISHASDADGLTNHEVAPANHEQALQLLLDWLEARHHHTLPPLARSFTLPRDMATPGLFIASPTVATTTTTCMCAATRRRAASTPCWNWRSRTRSTASAWPSM